MNVQKRKRRAKQRHTELERQRTHRAQHQKDPEYKIGTYGEKLALTRRARIKQQKCQHAPGILQCDVANAETWKLCEKCGCVCQLDEVTQ